MSKTASIALAIGAPIGIFLFIGVGGWMAMSALKPTPQKADQAPKGLAIFTVPVETADLQMTVRSQGEVKPRREISLSPQISGRINYVSPAFIDGGFVRKGDVLIRIEDADYKLDRIRAQSQVASAEQALVREEAQSDIARQDWEELGTGTPSPLAVREPQLAEARAALDAAKAQLQDTELALERTVVRAPFDGRIRTKEVDVGQFTSIGQSIGRMFGTEIAEVALSLSDDELGRLGLNLAFEESKENPGPRVTLSTQVAGKPRQWVGRITRTSAAVDQQTRLISAIATVDDPFGKGADGDAPLAPGLFVSATIEGELLKNVLTAPRSALRNSDQVYVANPETSTMSIKTVNVIYSSPDGVYMTSGIEPGDMAITSPVQAAFEGMNITIAGLDKDAGSNAEATEE